MPESEPHYDEQYYEDNGQSGDRPALRFYERLARRHLGTGPLLDFGCGTGWLLRRLVTRGPADGLEAHDHPATAAAALVPSATVFNHLDEIASDQYDGIVSIHVVEHLTDDELADVLEGWRRVLRPSGRALVVTPDRDGRAHRLKGDRWIAFTDPTHINLKSHTAWSALFAQHGFAVEQKAADGLWDFPYGRLPRLLDVAVRAWPTLFQFLRGDLLLRPGSGESVVLVVRAV